MVLNIISATVVVILEPYKEEYSTFNVLFADFFLWYGLFLETIANDNLYIILQVVFSDHYISSAILALIPSLEWLCTTVSGDSEDRKEMMSLVHCQIVCFTLTSTETVLASLLHHDQLKQQC